MNMLSNEISKTPMALEIEPAEFVTHYDWASLPHGNVHGHPRPGENVFYGVSKLDALTKRRTLNLV